MLNDLLLEGAFEQDERSNPLEAQLAKVVSVSSRGIQLLFDGASASDGKIYPCNACAEFRAGDRVKVAKVSGTYIVEYPIGAPGSRA